MKQILAAIFLLGAGVLAQADDITTNDGVTYRNVRVVKKTPLGIEAVSSDKAYWIDYRDLPPDVAVQYGYDSNKLQAYESNLQANNGCAMADNAVPDCQPVDANNANPPVTQANTYVVNSGTPVVYGFPGGGGYSYVYWNGGYYPWNAWHEWYWHHHWVNHNGRYYPAHYYYRHGVWENGKYYPYHPHRLYSGNPSEQHNYQSHECHGYHGGGGGGGHRR